MPRVSPMQQLSRARDADQRRNISISDPAHHVTDAIAHMYDDEEWRDRDARPFSFNPSPPQDDPERRTPYSEGPFTATGFEGALAPPIAEEKYGALPSGNGGQSVRGTHSRHSSLGTSPPRLARTPSSDTANQRFPLNDIDYESSPAAVAQELSNLQAIRRMSMNFDAADPDLPTFSPGGGVGSPTGASPPALEVDDPARLFWVPARLHPELAPKEFKTFVEDRVDLIRRRSQREDTLQPRGVDLSGSDGSLQRRKSRLSKTIDSSVGYEDGAEILERRRSQPLDVHERRKSETTLQELEHLVNDPLHLVRKISIGSGGAPDSGTVEAFPGEDVPILPAAGSGRPLKRSTHTNYRKGSLRKGERVAPLRRGTGKLNDGDGEEQESATPSRLIGEETANMLSRIQIAPQSLPKDFPGEAPRSAHKRSGAQVLQSSTSFDNLSIVEPQQRPQALPPSFHSRIATHGRTTAQLPGYAGQPLIPQTIEMPPPSDLRQNPTISLTPQAIPERKSSHEFTRANTMQTVPIERPPKRPDFSRTRSYNTPNYNTQTLDDMANNPSLMPGTSTRTDALSFIPTFAEEKRPEKKSSRDRKNSDEASSRKTGWGWLLGSDEKKLEKEREKEEKEASKKAKATKSGKITTDRDKGRDLTRLDALHTASGESQRGRESIVLDRDSINVSADDNRPFKSKIKSFSISATESSSSKKEKDSSTSLFSTLFSSVALKKKSAESSSTPIHSHTRPSKKSNPFATSRALSPDPPYRVLRADIDYNWTRFSILEERAIYRMAHIKLANPRRALASQVLLSNFMYSYLAKVQQMHPQMQIPQYTQTAQVQQIQKRGQQGTGAQNVTDEFAQWQAYQNHHEHISYNLDGTPYDHPPPNNTPYTQNAHGNYIDDYETDHQREEDRSAWPAYHEESSTYHEDGDGYDEGPDLYSGEMADSDYGNANGNGLASNGGWKKHGSVPMVGGGWEQRGMYEGDVEEGRGREEGLW